MVEKSVTDADSQSEEQERIKNLQAEYSRKLDKVTEEMTSKFDALSQKLDGLTRNNDDASSQTVVVEPNEREELAKISAAPRRYVETMIQPLKEANERLQKESEELRKATLTAQWERMEDRIARSEGKKDWKELPEDMQKGIRQEILARGWQGNPASAMDAYDIFKARRVNSDASDPDRLARIRGNQSEGGGRSSATRGSTQTISMDMVNELSRTLPSDPDKKKNMEILDKVQKGLIKVEG